MFFSPGYYAVLALYTALWVMLLRTAFKFLERRAGQAGSS